MPGKYQQSLPLVGGLNTKSDPRSIRDDQVQLNQNLFTTRDGALHTRPVSRWLAYVQGAGEAVGYMPRFLAVAPAATGASYVIGMVNPNTGTLELDAIAANGMSLAQYDCGTSFEKRPITVVYENDLYIWPGGDFEGFICLTGGFTQVPVFKRGTYNPDFGGVSPAQPQSYGAVCPRMAFSYNGRIVVGNFGLKWPASFSMCDYNFDVANDPAPQFFVPRPTFIGPDMLAFDAPHRFDVRDELEPLIGGIECMLQNVGSPTEVAAVMCTESHAYIMTGAMSETYDNGEENYPFSSRDGQLSVKRVNYDCGAFSQQSMVRTPYGVVWFGKDNVWMMDVGGAPRRIGSNIKDQLLACPPSLRWAAYSVFAQGVLRIGIPTANSGIVEGEDNEGDSRVDFNEFWLMMDDDTGAAGVPQDGEVKWFGPMHRTLYTPDGGFDLTQYTTPPVVNQEGRIIQAVRGYALSDFRANAVLVNTDSEDGVGIDLVHRVANAPMQFQAGSDYAVGDVICPPDGVMPALGLIYICVVGGTSSSTPGVWPASGDFTSGGCTFQEWNSRSATNQYMWNEKELELCAQLCAVQLSWLSKEYAHEDGMNNKTWQKFLVDCQSNRPATLTGSLLANQGAQKSSGSVVIRNTGAAKLGSIFLGTTMVNDIFSQRTIRPSEDVRPLFKRGAYQLETSPQVVIDETNDKVVFAANNIDIPTMTVVHGAWNSIGGFMQDLGFQMAAHLELYCGLLPGTMFVVANTPNLEVEKFQFIWNSAPVPSSGPISLVTNPGGPEFSTPDIEACQNLFSMLGFDSNLIYFIYSGTDDVESLTICGSTPVWQAAYPTWRFVEATVSGKTWRQEPFTNKDRESGGNT